LYNSLILKFLAVRCPFLWTENAGANNYAEYNMYNHSQMLKGLSPVSTDI